MQVAQASPTGALLSELLTQKTPVAEKFWKQVKEELQGYVSATLFHTQYPDALSKEEKPLSDLRTILELPLVWLQLLTPRW